MTSANLRPHPLRQHHGFTLVEVLVAVVVLSIGLLGLAGLHVSSLRNDQNSYFRSVATQLAYEMADRMRANVAGVTTGAYNNNAGTDDDCEEAACTPAQMAGYDITQWRNALTNKLPNLKTPQDNDYLITGLPGSVVGVVCIDSTPDDGTVNDTACDNNGADLRRGPYAVKIWWDDSRTGDPTKFQRFVMTVATL